jgi:hypothetical protein
MRTRTYGGAGQTDRGLMGSGRRVRVGLAYAVDQLSAGRCDAVRLWASAGVVARASVVTWAFGDRGSGFDVGQPGIRSAKGVLAWLHLRRVRARPVAGWSIDLPVTVPAAAAETLVVDARRRALTPPVVTDSIDLSGRSCDDATG